MENKHDSINKQRRVHKGHIDLLTEQEENTGWNNLTNKSSHEQIYLHGQTICRRMGLTDTTRRTDERFHVAFRFDQTMEKREMPLKSKSHVSLAVSDFVVERSDRGLQLIVIQSFYRSFCHKLGRNGSFNNNAGLKHIFLFSLKLSVCLWCLLERFTACITVFLHLYRPLCACLCMLYL